MDHDRLNYTAFGLSPQGPDRALEELRSKLRLKIIQSPMSDPSRALFSGIAVARSKIDNLKVLTFPSSIFQHLPTLSARRNIVQGSRVMDIVNPAMTSTTIGLLSSTAYRIFKRFDGVNEETLSGFASGVAKLGEGAPDFGSWEDHWKCDISRKSGSSSPMMVFQGRIMLVADVLMNLAYPSSKPIKFGLKRWCGEDTCVNPSHYISPEPSREIEKLGYYILVAPIPRTMAKPTPRYFFNALEGKPEFTSLWSEYLSVAEEYWRSQASDQDRDRGLPTDPREVSKLFSA